ncbi:uncharacterized protein LOC134276157 isoform X2 [Saccostrea cucullata]|uniref:uncharacterized protein LOC134276157 isoform X2 n=1 Tax=Saccostrea cuccullata TaxID=36930 RepID=UPI002ED1B15A
MLKIIRLLLFSLILDAYCERILADPYEPAETWFTTRPPSTIQNKGSVTPSAPTPFNKEREYAKILNLIRDVKKSLVKNNEEENRKNRQEEKERVNNEEKSKLKSVPLFPSDKKQNVVVKIPNHRKETTESQQTSRQAEHQRLVKHLRHLLTSEREKIRLGKHDPRKGPFHYGEVSKPIIIKTEPTAAATQDDEVANDKKKIEKQILKSKTPSSREDNLADLSALVHKLGVLANVSTFWKDKPKHSEMQQKTEKERPRDITEDQAFWVGLVVGCGVAVFVFAVCYFIAVLYRTFRRKNDGSHRPLDLNFNCPPESYKERYSTFSRMHDPKTGKKYIVLSDETKNYSISSSDSSEEEIYNASSHSPVSKPVHSPISKPALNVSNRSSMNRTSTPIKTPLRLTRSAPGSPSVRRNLSHSWTSPPVSPLASVTPVFASPVKLPG